MIRRLRAWWHRRRVREACETCNAFLKPKDAHHVTSGFSVDTHEIGMAGGGSISAMFCAKDCPGGCDHERKGTYYEPTPDPHWRKLERPLPFPHGSVSAEAQPIKVSDHPPDGIPKEAL